MGAGQSAQPAGLCHRPPRRPQATSGQAQPLLWARGRVEGSLTTHRAPGAAGWRPGAGGRQVLDTDVPVPRPGPGSLGASRGAAGAGGVCGHLDASSCPVPPTPPFLGLKRWIGVRQAPVCQAITPKRLCRVTVVPPAHVTDVQGLAWGPPESCLGPPSLQTVGPDRSWLIRLPLEPPTPGMHAEMQLPGPAAAALPVSSQEPRTGTWSAEARRQGRPTCPPAGPQTAERAHSHEGPCPQPREGAKL